MPHMVVNTNNCICVLACDFSCRAMTRGMMGLNPVRSLRAREAIQHGRLGRWGKVDGDVDAVRLLAMADMG